MLLLEVFVFWLRNWSHWVRQGASFKVVLVRPPKLQNASNHHCGGHTTLPKQNKVHSPTLLSGPMVPNSNWLSFDFNWQLSATVKKTGMCSNTSMMSLTSDLHVERIGQSIKSKLSKMFYMSRGFVESPSGRTHFRKATPGPCTLHAHMLYGYWSVL